MGPPTPPSMKEYVEPKKITWCSNLVKNLYGMEYKDDK